MYSDVTARAVDEHHLEVTNGHLEPGRIYSVVACPPDTDRCPMDRSFPSLSGSVLQYHDPFGPAIDPSEWEVLKDVPG